MPTRDDLVERQFARSDLDELWVTAITEHRTREGNVSCFCVMDTCSRRIVGWSIDSVQDSQLVVNALDIAIKQRRTKRGGIVHADHGVQFTSWSFTGRTREAGLSPSFGSVGDAFDNAMMESFWSSMQIELLDHKRWRTRLELTRPPEFNSQGGKEAWGRSNCQLNRQQSLSSVPACHRESFKQRKG